MLTRLKSCVPEMPMVLLHAINDGNEQWSALRHAPARSASEALSLGAVFHGRSRALEGFLACLADGVKAEEWKELGKVWKVAMCEAKGPLGIRVVWSDRAFDREFDTCTKSRDASSKTLQKSAFNDLHLVSPFSACRNPDGTRPAAGSLH